MLWDYAIWWTADQETALEILNHAFDAGINFIDTADIYSRLVEGNPRGVLGETLEVSWQASDHVEWESDMLSRE